MTLKQLAKNKKITHCYIYKDGYYYRPKSCGYTEYVIKAGVYTKEEAINSAQLCKELRLIPIDISKHNQEIKEEIQSLINRLIF